jgi:DNA polymerase-3 subunit beta
MKFKIKKNDIVDVLSKLQGITGRKSNLAITENILLKTVEGGIHIIVTDLETGFEGTYPAENETDGIIAINARKFYEIIRDFPNDEILINEIENRWLEIGNENVEYHLVSMNPEDFPETPVIEDVGFFEIESGLFKKMIEKTVSVSGASDDKRAHINGIFIDKVNVDGNDFIRLVSTDGSRLSMAEYGFEGDSVLPQMGSVLIPKKGLAEVSKFLSGAGLVNIGVKGNHFVVKKASETIIVRLLEGEFPAYNDIIAKNDQQRLVKMDKKPFQMMLKRMSILSSEDYKGVIFKLADDKIIVTATNPDVGESREEMEISFSWDPIEAAFNPKFFMEALNSIETEQVLLHIVDEEKPCLVEGENDSSFISVIMPMRI